MMYHKKVITTKDGSKTFFIEHLNETYHSKIGAVLESKHVYINHGLLPFLNKPKMEVLEFGFGTGLNALLSLDYAQQNKQVINYETFEAFPFLYSEIVSLDYPNSINVSEYYFKLMHSVSWGELHSITPYFNLTKRKERFENFLNTSTFDVVFFDVFCPRVQPELWTPKIFRKLFLSLKEEGVLVTYASNKTAKEALTAAGFYITKFLKPSGKNECILAFKNKHSIKHQ